jgi:GxxExxY protein
VPDLIIDGKVIIDTKVVKEINSKHISKMQSYLNITGLNIGLIINFKYSSVKIRKVAKTDQPTNPEEIKLK